MEASSVTAPGQVGGLGAALRSFLGRHGLIIVLLVLPVRYGIQDLQDDGSISHLATNIKDGISNGAIWALVALGYTLVYGIIELINFAHGDVFMLGSFTAQQVWHGILGVTLATSTLGIIGGLAATLVITMLVSGSMNTLIEKVAYKPLRNAPK